MQDLINPSFRSKCRFCICTLLGAQKRFARFSTYVLSQVEPQQQKQRRGRTDSRRKASSLPSVDIELEEIEVAIRPTLAAMEKPVVDQSRLWEAIGAAQFSADGDAGGWDSDASDHETPDEKYLKVCQTD